MYTKTKKFLRRQPIAVKVYRFGKNILLWPLRFTSFKELQLVNFPLVDLFRPEKTKLLRTVAPYTKAGYPRLSNIYNLSLDIEERNLPGAFVECGTWKGGCAAVMAAIAGRYGARRMTWYFDSYEGMPEFSEKDGPRAERIMGEYLHARVSDVEEIVFGKLGLKRDKNKIVKGWFEDTLAKNKKEIGPIAILRLDADWYSSTKTILEELYDQVVPGGYLIFDDYGTWPGCREAVHEFLDKRNIKPEMKFIGTYDLEVYNKIPPMYFQKP